MKTLYTAHAKAVGAREGHAETDDKNVSVNFALPGSGKLGTNPEQLFACGYGACFGGALAAAARQNKVDIGTPEVAVDIDLNQGGDGYSIGATLNISITKLDQAAAEKVARDAHQICPYSKATRGNIKVTLKVNDRLLA